MIGSIKDTKRATLAATVTMSGNVLSSTSQFKGKKWSPMLAPKPTCCSKKAWMDEYMMDLWIDKCLDPLKYTFSPSIVTLLVLDSVL